jgi:hypothetical protein
MSDIMQFNQIDVSKITFGPIQVNERIAGARTVPILYNGRPLRFQTPEMYAPFGLNRFAVNDAPGVTKEKYSIEMSFKNLNQPPGNGTSDKAIKREQQFFALLSDIDLHVRKSALENSTAWLKQKYPNNEQGMIILDALYTPVLRFHKDKLTGEKTGQYPPTFRLNLPTYNNSNQLNCMCYNREGERIDIFNTETKRGRIAGIVSATSIWITGNKFGVNWKAEQLMIQPSMIMQSFGFKPFDDEEPTAAAQIKPSMANDVHDLIDGPPPPTTEGEVVADPDDSMTAASPAKKSGAKSGAKARA